MRTFASFGGQIEQFWVHDQSTSYRIHARQTPQPLLR